MTVSVELPAEVEAKLARIAAFWSLSLDAVLVFAVVRLLEVQEFIIQDGGDMDAAIPQTVDR